MTSHMLSAVVPLPIHWPDVVLREGVSGLGIKWKLDDGGIFPSQLVHSQSAGCQVT